jgi:hypothetical protein
MPAAQQKGLQPLFGFLLVDLGVFPGAGQIAQGFIIVQRSRDI